MVMSRSAEQWEARIGRRVRLRDLHTLLTVVHSGSMAKAAQRLAVSQPAISKAVAELEHAMGVRLLDRGPRGVQPTLYGAVLIRRGLAVFDELRQGVGEIEFMADSTSGEVRIGCNESLSVALLPAVIARLAKQHPGIVLRVVPMSRPITAEAQELRERNVDLIIGRGIMPVPEDDLDAEVLFREPLIAVAGSQSQWARRRKLNLAELVGEKWILHPDHEAPGLLVREAFAAQGLEMPRASVVTMSFHLRQMLLMTGEYLSVIPASMVRVFNARQKMVSALAVDLGIEPRPVALFTLKSRTLSPVVELFVKCARSTAQSMTM